MRRLKARIERRLGIVFGGGRPTSPDHRIYVRIGWGGDMVEFEAGFVWWFVYAGKV